MASDLTHTTEPAPLQKLTVFGHRGARGHAPENTLLALDRAMHLGVDWIEFDVQAHPSGALLILHDLTVDRTTNGRGSLRDLPFDTVRKLDAGEGQMIPTLDEALDLIEQQVGVNVEIKSANGCGVMVASMLRRYVDEGWPLDKLLVSSFHLPELWEFHQAAPEIPVAVLLGGVPLDWAGCASELEAVAVNCSDEFVDPRLIADAHAHGRKVNVYTVNDAETMRELSALGVDGIFTDYPDRVPEELRRASV